jgi:general secretion pathway protein A
VYEDYFGFDRLPFSITPDPHFFYDNPGNREAFAGLHYGIEGRKGFIVITGEAGTGKTTLLKVFMQRAPVTIRTAFVFNPKLSATELLRSILNDLNIAASTENPGALTRQLNDYLIEQLKKRHIVALLVDEAQHLSSELLEELRLLSNLETHHDKLIQIVLMGQPELEERLDQPELRQLKQRVTVRCRLAPLKGDEVNFYIEARLKTAGFAEKALFDPKAVEKITLYSRGIPRLINVICDNALLICYAASKRNVSAEFIEEVAHDLQLTAPPPIEKQPAPVESEKPKDRDRTGDEVKIKKEAEPSTWVSPNQPAEFQNFFIAGGQRRKRIHWQRNLAGLGIGFAFGVLVTAGLGAIFYSQPNRNNISDMAARIDDPINRRENLKSAALAPGTLKEGTLNELKGTQGPASERPPILEQPPGNNRIGLGAPSIPEATKVAPSQAVDPPAPSQEKSTVKNTKNDQENTKSPAKRSSENQVGVDRRSANDRLEFAIYKAIANRAITGVEVSVRDGTAFLNGRVATESQKNAVAQAALSVPGVKSIRDQILINEGVVPRYGDARGGQPRVGG